MKKLTVDQKARFYDEAIEKLGVILNLNTVKESGTISVEDIRKIFPELKESEDEKIRKHIINVLKDNFSGEDTDKCITWLEKQGEQKPDWSEEDESRMNNLCHFLDEYGDQYYGHLTLQGTISWLKSIKDRVQPKQEWSEEDEKIALSIEQVMNCASLLNIVPEKVDKIRTWLKSLKQRIGE